MRQLPQSIYVVLCLSISGDVLKRPLQPLMMGEKWIEVAPKDVIWDNIDVLSSSLQC